LKLAHSEKRMDDLDLLSSKLSNMLQELSKKMYEQPNQSDSESNNTTATDIEYEEVTPNK